jgi:hypothetical protein
MTFGIAAVAIAGVVFAGCSFGQQTQNVTPTSDVPSATIVPTTTTPDNSAPAPVTSPQGQSMVQPAPQADAEAASDTVLKAPALSSGSDTKSLDADLQNTNVSSEQFN